MRKSFLSAVTATSLAWAAAAFECSEDFSVADERGGSYGFDIWRNSTLSHLHGWIEGGRYRIPVDGNRHFIAAPKLGDFRLDLDYALVPFRRLDLTLGYVVYFRYDRAARGSDPCDTVDVIRSI